MVAQERGDLDDAQKWYEKSLALKEELGNRPGLAISYHQLGKFLSAIENAKLFIHIDEFEVTRGQNDAQSALVRMTLSTWYVPPLAKL
jgi:hypothetical protein